MSESAPDPALFVCELQKIGFFLSFLLIAFCRYIYIILHRYKAINKSQHIRNQGFSFLTIFALYGRIRIRIHTSDKRIREAQKLTDPEHCYVVVNKF